MSPWSGPITIAEIFLANNNWKRYLAWKAGQVRLAVIGYVSRMLACRTAKLGLHLLLCALWHGQSDPPQLQVCILLQLWQGTHG